ncbi:MAG TPA: UvrD-helicase domain-containing protein [Opitutaceae bacterium]|nr:UvrD-helicase domain-containing protein [Opitutaceae bacterium]
MVDLPTDQAARDRFTNEWGVNLAVAANAGSGKTTAISERLAAMALSAAGAEMLGRTAVVTYTKKAAAQIGQRARAVLLHRMTDAGSSDPAPLSRLDRAFFGTIHSFCLLLARRHGSAHGVHLNPTLVDDGEDACWQEFLEQDPMAFSSLSDTQMACFLRHAALDEIFGLAKELNLGAARRLAERRPPDAAPGPSSAVLEEILAAVPLRKGPGASALERNKRTAREWLRKHEEESDPLPIPAAEGSAAGIRDLYRRFFAPLKGWLADAGGVLAAELSLRYRGWRFDRGIQTYADQIETAAALLDDVEMLERIRGEGWRVILDEAQDADPKQFDVLVEISRPPGAALGTWPSGAGIGPRAGHFCMVGDAQQAIYSTRADIRNFQVHIDAFANGNGGELLTFDVTFRTPRRVVRLLNATLGGAFGRGRAYNLGLPPSEGAPAPLLQVAYEPLVPGPANPEGGAWMLPITSNPVDGPHGVDDRRLADEARQIARFLASAGSGSVGAPAWGDICIMAPRKAWLSIVRDEFESAGLKIALQMRRNRNGDNPVYAWLSGLLAVACDPENTFEWVGVLREVFGVSDSVIAASLGSNGDLSWDEPEGHAKPVGAALDVLRPFVGRADGEGESLGRFAEDLAAACGLAHMARLADPEGGLEDELARLLARAAELGAGGAGPRAWLRDLLESTDGFRASGRPAPDAINLITSHSAKGLEWPVVIPVGLWRTISSREPTGLRIVSERGGVPEVVFDNDGVSEDARDLYERARLRELVRLLYVTLTRARGALVVPWAAQVAPGTNSFAELWDLDPGGLDPLPAPSAGAQAASARKGAGAAPAAAQAAESAGAGGPVSAARAPAMPMRILPHELARAPDQARAARHESSVGEPSPVNDGADPLDYGIWWHETLEFLPWAGDLAAVAAHGESSMAKAAEMGFEARGREEWGRLLESEPWRLVRDARWTRLAEVGVLAPLGADAWIDGVMDLVLHDPNAREVWIVDWKTNRRTGVEDDSALLGRLAADYEGQLRAYRQCASAFFPDCPITLWIYSTVAGAWTRVGSSS